MQVQLRKPELKEFIEHEVKAGRFPSPEAAVEAAVERMMIEGEDDELDDETVAAINRAEEQIERGDGIDFRQFADAMRKKFVS